MLIDDYTPYLRTIIQNMVSNNLSEEDKEEIIIDTFFILWKRYTEGQYSYFVDCTTGEIIGGCVMDYTFEST